MSDKSTLISDIHELKEIKKQLEDVINSLKSSISAISDKIDAKELQLISYMKQAGVEVDTEVENLVAAIFRKESIGYKDELEVLKMLKDLDRNDLIKTKVSENLDKVAIKKALKTDLMLSEKLENMTVRSNTEYVVVTTQENYAKMLEHINE